MALSRDQWRKRLLDADIPETVVEATLKGMTDDDLLRMKDMSDLTADQLRAKLREADILVLKGECPGCGADLPAEAVKCEKCGMAIPGEDETEKKKDGEDDLIDVTEAFNELAGKLKDDIAQMLGAQELELEVPALAVIQEQLTVLQKDVEAVKEALGTISELKDAMHVLAQSEEQRLQEIAKDMSPATQARLMVHRQPPISDDEAAAAALRIQQFLGLLPMAGQKSDEPGGLGAGSFVPVIRDSHGNEYTSLEAMAQGQPVAQ